MTKETVYHNSKLTGLVLITTECEITNGLKICYMFYIHFQLKKQVFYQIFLKQ